MLHFDELDFDAPGVGALVDDLLELGVELLPLRKEVVEIDLPEDAPERGLGELGGTGQRKYIDAFPLKCYLTTQEPNNENSFCLSRISRYLLEF
jgi:hypothetical protein